MSVIVSQKKVTILVCNVALVAVYSCFVYHNTNMIHDTMFSLLCFILISTVFIVVMLVMTTSIDEIFDKALEQKESKRPKGCIVKYK